MKTYYVAIRIQFVKTDDICATILTFTALIGNNVHSHGFGYFFHLLCDISVAYKSYSLAVQLDYVLYSVTKILVSCPRPVGYRTAVRAYTHSKLEYQRKRKLSNRFARIIGNIAYRYTSFSRIVDIHDVKARRQKPDILEIGKFFEYVSAQQNFVVDNYVCILCACNYLVGRCTVVIHEIPELLKFAPVQILACCSISVKHNYLHMLFLNPFG